MFMDKPSKNSEVINHYIGGLFYEDQNCFKDKVRYYLLLINIRLTEHLTTVAKVSNSRPGAMLWIQQKRH